MFAPLDFEIDGDNPIDWDRPRSQGLVGCWFFNLTNAPDGATVPDLTGNNHVSIVNPGPDLTTTVGVFGRGLNFPDSAGSDRASIGSIAPGNPMHFADAEGLTWVTAIRYVSPSDFPRFYDKSDGGSGANGEYWGVNKSGGVDEHEFYWGGARRITSGSTGLSENNDYILAARVTGIQETTKTVTLFNNGTFDSDTSTASWSNVTTNAAFGQWNHSTTSRRLGGPMFFFMAYRRGQSDQEIIDAWLDPYGILWRPKFMVLLPPAAVVGLDFSAAALSSASANASVTRGLGHAANVTSALTGDLSTNRGHSTQFDAVSALSASLERTSGVAPALSGASGSNVALSTVRGLTPSVVDQSVMSAALSRLRGIAPALASTSSQADGLEVQRPLDMVVGSVSVVTVDLTITSDTLVDLSFSIPVTSAIAVGLSGSRPLSLQVTGVSVVSGTLEVLRPLSFAVSGVSAISVDLSISSYVVLDFTMDAASSVSGAMSTGRGLIVDIVGSSSVSGDITLDRGLTSGLLALSSLAASASVFRPLMFALTAQSVIGVNLTVVAEGVFQDGNPAVFSGAARGADFVAASRGVDFTGKPRGGIFTATRRES